MEILIASAITMAFIGIMLIKYNNLKRNFKLELESRDNDLQEQENESIKEFIDKLTEVDKQVEERIKEVQMMNTVTFECPCQHNVINVSIDLSKEENTFVCPECKNEYRVDINMLPILKGRIIDEHNMFNLLSEKYDSVASFRKIEEGDNN